MRLPHAANQQTGERMSRPSIPPHLTLSEDMVVASPANGWILQREGHVPLVIEDGEILPAWDTELRFELHRTFAALGKWQEHLGFPSGGAEFGMVTRLVTAGGLLSEVVDVQPLSSTSDSDLVVIVRPSSREIAKDIRIHCCIILCAAGPDGLALAPADKGARLWADRWSARIEGGRARLPFELASFSKELRGYRINRALFHVEVAEDPELDFEQAVCVYLNTDNPSFVKAIEQGAATETALLWDGVMRRLIITGLGQTFEGDAWPPDSLGMQVARWLVGIFPGQSREALTRMVIADPSRFEALIQSWTDVASHIGVEPSA